MQLKYEHGKNHIILVGLASRLKKLLMVCYFFPPLGGVGVLRSLKFAKYLLQFGWEPIVITVRNSSYGTRDESLLSEILARVKVHRAFSVEHRLVRYFFNRTRINSKTIMIPDEYIGWLPGAVIRACLVCWRERPNVIYASGPPYTALLAGALVAEIMRIPLVIDYRDPWGGNPYIRYPSKWHEKIENIVESYVLSRAHRVVVATVPMRKRLLDLNTWLDPGSVITITNGYDEEDFVGLPIRPKDNRFRVTHTGSFYAGIQPNDFLKAAALAKSQEPQLNERLELAFVGSSPPSGLVRELGLEQNVQNFGWVSHRQALRIASWSDALLLIQPRTPSNGKAFEYHLTGKIFEYIRLSKPIIAIGGKGAIRDLLATIDEAICVEADDSRSISKALGELFRSWRRGRRRLTPQRNISRFDRKYLAQRLAAVLDEL